MSEKDECAYCGNNLTDEEIEYPQLDGDGDNMCDECYHEHFEFTCDFCENYEHIDHQHELLVVWEEISEVTPGVYRILKGPYWGSCYFNSWLYPDTLERVGDLPSRFAGIEESPWGYPCGHLCRDCQKPFAVAQPVISTPAR